MNRTKQSLLMISFMLMTNCETAEQMMTTNEMDIEIGTELIDQNLNLISTEIEAINKELESDF